MSSDQPTAETAPFINQVELIGAICIELDRQGVKAMVPRQYNTIVAAANRIIEELGKPAVGATAGMGMAAWLASDDTGLSSLYMAAVLSEVFSRPYAHPHDADDFGRCVRLLEAVPELAPKLDLMRKSGPVWNYLINSWASLTASFACGDFSSVTERIGRIIENCRAEAEA